MPLTVIGLFWNGWNTQAHAFWFVPILGLCLVGLGITTVQVSCPDLKIHILMLTAISFTPN